MRLLTHHFLAWLLCLITLCPDLNAAPTWSDCWRAYSSGNYAEAIKLAEEGRRANRRVEDWRLILIRANLMVGNLEAARKALDEAVDDFATYGLRIRIAGHELAKATGNTALARDLLQDLGSMAGPRTRDNATNLVAIGQAAIPMGIEPRLILENFFNQAKKRSPDYREVYLAAGSLALEKNDFALAADWFRDGLTKSPDDADLHYGLARALSNGDRTQMAAALMSALKTNPRHIPSLLLTADHAIDGEQYAEAERYLARVLEVNANHPEAWAYRSVLAHLASKPEDEAKARARALTVWKTNPQVDHLIGLKLSQKYRFKEGSEHQRKALEFDPDHLAAQLQLAQDLLRLGQDEEGWKLAEQAHEKDGYQVTAYNLTTLRDALSKFTVLTNAHFQVRMVSHEAAVYGNRVLSLLEEARTKLTAKYGAQLEDPTYVEIFNDSKDFAVRTFGMPDNPGFLGVCFGRVVTANSPATTTANPANWEAVLWHEFCHVITLTVTRNKMPRWLSEGISVYEERQANSTWGHPMDLKFRELILTGKLAPISKMSSSFLTPDGNDGLQFAYFQAGMVVDFLVERGGLEKLRLLLQDLGEGKEINPSLEARYGDLKTLEKDFEKQAKTLAEGLAPGVDASRPGKGFTKLGEDREAWEATHPNNYLLKLQKAQKLVADKKWEEAEKALTSLLQTFSGRTGAANPHLLLARVHRALKRDADERRALEAAVAMDADAVDALRRLLEIDEKAQDWSALKRHANQHLAVDPLLCAPYLALAKASEALSDPKTAIQALQTALLLDPPRPAETHFQLARLLHADRRPEARRHVLLALEEAPRFLEAHKLLAQIAKETPTAP